MNLVAGTLECTSQRNLVLFATPLKMTRRISLTRVTTRRNRPGVSCIEMFEKMQLMAEARSIKQGPSFHKIYAMALSMVTNFQTGFNLPVF